MWFSFSKSDQVFSPHLLNNYFGLERYLSGEEDLARIEGISKSKYPLRKPTSTSPYFNRWDVIWITLKYPFVDITSTFFTCVAFLLSSLQLHKYGSIAQVLSSHMTRDWEQLSDQWTFKQPMLMPAFNVPSAFSYDVYGHGDFPYEGIKDEKVREFAPQKALYNEGIKQGIKVFYKSLENNRRNLNWAVRLWRGSTVSERDNVTREFTKNYTENPIAAFEKLKSKYSSDDLSKPLEKLYSSLKTNIIWAKCHPHLNLYSSDGVCRGESLWFIKLFLKSTDHFKNKAAAHIMAVAKQFKAGAPGQGSLLQALSNPEEALKIEKTEMSEHYISLYELDEKSESAQKKIDSLPNGIYRVGVYLHSFVYIKLSETESYCWNPDFGLFQMNGEQVLNMIYKHHYKQGDPAAHVYFHQYESTENLED